MASHRVQESVRGRRLSSPPFVRVADGPIRTGVSRLEQMFYTGLPRCARPRPERPVAQTPYAELHCHTNFSFLDGASPSDDLVERAVELGLTGLAVTDHAGLYGVGPLRRARPRPSACTRSSGWRSSCSTRPWPTPTGRDPATSAATAPASRGRDGRTGRPRRRRRPGAAHRRDRGRAGPARGPSVPGSPAIASRSRRTCAGSASGVAARTSCCWPARRSAGGACAGSSRGRTWPGRRRCRASARRSWPSTPRGSSRCRAAATGRSPAASGRATGRARRPSRNATPGSSGGATDRPRAAS